MNELRFIVFRHGETDWNAEGRFQGHTDIELNSSGRIQAQKLALKVQDIKFDIMLCSDLKRARDTADAIARPRQIDVIESASLREAKLGDPEGLLRSDIITTYGSKSWERWSSIKPEDLEFRFPNGESKVEHLNRVRNFLEAFAQSHPSYSTIGVSTHGGSLRRLLHFCDESPKEAIPLPNCSTFEISFCRNIKQWKYLREI